MEYYQFLKLEEGVANLTVSVQLINVDSGNLNSIRNAFSLIGVAVREVRLAAELNDTDPIILPGVGAFGTIARRLEKRGFFSALRAVPSRQQPLLGICLGMQILGDYSEESPGVRGLGVIPGVVRSLSILKKGTKVPNIGWRNITGTNNAESAVYSLLDNKLYYHMHSYFFEPADQMITDATLPFNEHFVPAAISNGSITAVQFHPEKSQEDGLNFLEHWAYSAGAFA